MNIHPIEFSIVVVGQDCNPTILNPDFLKYRKIVPDDWGWKLAGPAITTPPFATVPYDSGVTVTVEPSQFLVTDRSCGDHVEKSKIPEIAKAYVAELPNVRYTALGINFRSLVEMEVPDAYLKERFVKPGPWNQGERALETVSLTLGYAHEDGRLSLSMERATVVTQEEEASTQIHGVLAAANYHREWTDYPGDTKVVESIAYAQKDASHFQSTLHELLADVDVGSTT